MRQRDMQFALIQSLGGGFDANAAGLSVTAPADASAAHAPG
jgi:hypothetical protein